MMLDRRAVARALGGSVSGRHVIAPGPGHTRADRSISIEIDPTAPDGFRCNSFAGDDWRECRDHVRQALGLGAWRWRRRSAPFRPIRPMAPSDDGAGERTALVLRLWNEAHDPRDAAAAVYLASRGLTLSDDVAGDVIRFHPKLKFEGIRAGAMVALFRDVASNEPCGIHRTFLDGEERKLDRRMLGRARCAAIKLERRACGRCRRVRTRLVTRPLPTGSPAAANYNPNDARSASAARLGIGQGKPGLPRLVWSRD